MKKRLSILVLSLSLLVFSGCNKKNDSNEKDTNESSENDKIKSVTILKNNQKVAEFTVEIADSTDEQQKGLMYREKMDDSHGMLFIFSDFSSGGFWMKDTYIPLDIIFIDRDMKVLNIENATPCRAEDPKQNFCRTYNPKSPYKYVLEINGGLSKKLGIKEGSVLQLNEE